MHSASQPQVDTIKAARTQEKARTCFDSVDNHAHILDLTGLLLRFRCSAVHANFNNGFHRVIFFLFGSPAKFLHFTLALIQSMYMTPSSVTVPSRRPCCFLSHSNATARCSSRIFAICEVCQKTAIFGIDRRIRLHNAKHSLRDATPPPQ